MQLRHRVALDGIQLDEIDSRIMIQRIETGEGKENISSVSLNGSPMGSRITGIHRDSLDITVRFAIKARKTEMVTRETVLEKANEWAWAGGWLTTNYKENRRIRVFRAQAAAMGDPWEWTKNYAIVFRACGVPYWQEEAPGSVSRKDTRSEIFTMGVNGSEKSVLDVSFTNTSGGTINSFSIDTGESTMILSGMGLQSGETLEIDHNDNGKICLQRIRIRSGSGYRSVRDRRTQESSNELEISPGIHKIRMAAGGNGKITISCSGRYA